jgi:hypothetical protein
MWRNLKVSQAKRQEWKRSATEAEAASAGFEAGRQSEDKFRFCSTWCLFC